MYTLRANQEQIYSAFNNQFITALLGSRRVGKTSLVENFISRNDDALWVKLNMDVLAEREKVESIGIRKIIEVNAEQKIGGDKKIWVAIDEAQKCPELFEQIKVIYDEHKNKNAIKFILTGSGFLSLHQLSAETLAGRIYLFYLREFSLREMVAFRTAKPLLSDSIFVALCDDLDFEGAEKIVDDIAPFQIKLNEALTSGLIWGGLPEMLSLEQEQERIAYLANYLQTYLEKDVRALGTIADVKLYQHLMEVVAEQTGSLRDDQRILQALQCSRDTVKKYRNYLTATLMYQEIYPFIDSTLRRLVKSPKAYLINNGLVSYLSGIYDLEILCKTGIIGHRLENWFLQELQIWLDRDAKKSQIYFWRTSGNVEVDFVVNKNPYVFPCEVTYNKHIEARKVKHLKTFLNEYKNAPFGLYIYNGKFIIDKKAKICFLPAWVIG